MALTLEYSNDSQAYLAQQKTLAPEQWALAKSAYYRLLAFQCVVLLLAVFAAFKAELIALVGFFIACLVAHIVISVPFSKPRRAAMRSAAGLREEKQVRLVVDEAGLHETVEGIESFAPWSSVLSFGIHDEVLLVQLKGGLWALIPNYALKQPSASVEELVAELKRRGVRERAAVPDA